MWRSENKDKQREKKNGRSKGKPLGLTCTTTFFLLLTVTHKTLSRMMYTCACGYVPVVSPVWSSRAFWHSHIFFFLLFPFFSFLFFLLLLLAFIVYTHLLHWCLVVCYCVRCFCSFSPCFLSVHTPNNTTHSLYYSCCILLSVCYRHMLHETNTIHTTWHLYATLLNATSNYLLSTLTISIFICRKSKLTII